MNRQLQDRMQAFFGMLDQVHAAGGALSSNTKGYEREAFVRGLLQQVFPSHYLFGNGDIMDSYGEKSGQVDVVVSNPTALSFPIIADGPRLFLAESVAAVIEVKSDLSNQWDEVMATANKVAALKRHFAKQYYKGLLDLIQFAKERGREADQGEAMLKAGMAVSKDQLGERIPLIAVGYQGWKTQETIQEKIKASNGSVTAVFNLDTQMFCTIDGVANGPYSMWQFLTDLLRQLQLVSEPLPLFITYASEPPQKSIQAMIEAEKRGAKYSYGKNIIVPGDSPQPPSGGKP